jgi:hypothetical protein
MLLFMILIELRRQRAEIEGQGDWTDLTIQRGEAKRSQWSRNCYV